jgi:hypothetical protein
MNSKLSSNTLSDIQSEELAWLKLGEYRIQQFNPEDND